MMKKPRNKITQPASKPKDALLRRMGERLPKRHQVFISYAREDSQ